MNNRSRENLKTSTEGGLDILEDLAGKQENEYPPAPLRVENKDEAVKRAQKDVKASYDIGAKNLSRIGFHTDRRYTQSVQTSYERSVKKGEKLPGDRSDQRNAAYILSLEKALEDRARREKERKNKPTKRRFLKKVGGIKENTESDTDTPKNELEKRLWEFAVGSQIIDRDNIPKGATEEEVERILEAQKESLKSWSNYLSDPNNSFPIWFQLYAWAGMTKMGAYDNESKRFKKRDEKTTAPYPKLNVAALVKTYDAVRGQYKADELEGKELQKLIQSGNFANLYNHFVLTDKKILPTPEKTEDIKGHWVEYLPGQEKELAIAAEGTQWCIASQEFGKGYLRNPDSRFLLFHLQYPDSEKYSESACASIRIEKGKVVEISGLKNGPLQILEDSLVPIVREKVMSLPGGEIYKEAFDDKSRIIDLDHKIKNGEGLSDDDVRFIFEIDRTITHLNSRFDPRILEIRGYAGIEALKQIDITTDEALMRLGPKYIGDNLDKLINEKGIPLEQIVKRLDASEISSRLETLLDYGLNPNDAIVDNRHQMEELVKRGADVNKLLDNNVERNVWWNFSGKDVGDMIKHGADPRIITSTCFRFSGYDLPADKMINFFENGIPADLYIEELCKQEAYYYNDKKEAKYWVNYYLHDSFELLRDYGASPKLLRDNMSRMTYFGKSIGYRIKKIFGLKMDYEKELEGEQNN